MKEISPNATDFDTFELDEVVVRRCDFKNLNGGFHIKGWYKLSLDEDGAANDLRKLHFRYFQPAEPLDFMELARRY